MSLIFYMLTYNRLKWFAWIPLSLGVYIVSRNMLSALVLDKIYYPLHPLYLKALEYDSLVKSSNSEIEKEQEERAIEAVKQFWEKQQTPKPISEE